MTKEEETVLLIKGAISDLPETDRAKVMQYYAAIKGMMAETPLHAGMAVALIGAELAVLAA